MVQKYALYNYLANYLYKKLVLKQINHTFAL